MIKRRKLINHLVLDYIKRYLLANDEAPTITEIGQEFEMSVAGVHGVLKRLENKGLIRRTPNIARGISLPDADLMFAGREG